MRIFFPQTTTDDRWNKSTTNGVDGSRTQSASCTRCVLCYFLIVLTAIGGACSRGETTATDAPESASRTEFTDRVENYFEYEPLKRGKRSQFLIHLTDLLDGAPVEKAEVSLTVRPQGSQSIVA